MSALDDIIAADSKGSAAGSALDAIIAADSGGAGGGRGSINPTAPQEAQGSLAALGGGLGHGFGSAILGAQQLMGHGLSAAGASKVGDWLTKDANQGLAKLDAEYQPLSDAHPVIAGTGNVGGQIGATMLPAGAIAKVAPAYTALSLGGKVALGAAQGAAGAAMMPVDPGSNSYWADKGVQTAIGGGTGAATPVVASAATAAGKGLWNVVQPVLQPQKYVAQGIAAGMSPAEAAAAATNIRSAPQFVPGSMPTTAQAGQTPYLVQTEKAASNLPSVKTGMIQRGIDNNAARWGALNQVAGSPADLAAALASRSQAAAPLYAAAHAASAPVDATLGTLMQRPAVQQAMTAADTLARNEGVQLTMPTAQNPTISGQALDYAHRALGDMIDTAQRSGSNQEVRALTGAQNDLRQWGQTNIPEVGQAARTFASMSPPVNTMEAGQQMADTLGSRALNAAGAPDIQLPAYRSALAQALRNAEHGIDPQAEAALQGIQQDLQRSSVSNSVRSPGSDTAYNLAANGWLAKNLYGPGFQGASGVGKAVAAGATALAGHPYAALGVLGGATKAGQMVGGRLESNLAQLLLNPQALAPYLDARAASVGEAVNDPLRQALLNYGRPALVNGALGGFIEPANK